MTTPKELQEAVASYKNGEQKAFNMIYELSQNYIYVCVRNVMYKQDSIDDAIADMMQETYLEISKSIGQLVDEKDFLSWASTIANRKCFAYLKKNNKLVLLPEEDQTFDTLADDENIIPESIMQDKEKQRLIREIVNQDLTKMQQLCIIGFYYNEQKQEEIAAELNIPLNTVKTNLSRARAKIKDGVLVLEKKKGTRLYSLAPIMLFLFEEEVQACVVPVKIGNAIISSVLESSTVAGITIASSGVTTATTTSAVVHSAGFAGKIAAMSIKAKLLVAAIAVTTIGIGTVAAAKLINPSSEKEQKIESVIVPALLEEIPEEFVETEITLPQEQMATLEYLISSIVTTFDTEPDLLIQALSTDERKKYFLFTMLNDNYWINDGFYGDETDCVPVINAIECRIVDVEPAIYDMESGKLMVYDYSKEVIDVFMNNLIGSTIQNPNVENIYFQGLSYADEKYTLEGYTDYSTKTGGGNPVTINKIVQVSEEDVILEGVLTDMSPGELDVIYKITICAKVNPSSPCGYTIQNYYYTQKEEIVEDSVVTMDSNVWQDMYKEFLLEDLGDKKLGFDIKDMDDDQIPELLVKTNRNGIENILIYKYQESEPVFVFECVTYAEFNSEFSSEKAYCTYGYGESPDEIIELQNSDIVLNDYPVASEAALMHVYKKGTLNDEYALIPDISIMGANIYYEQVYLEADNNGDLQKSDASEEFIVGILNTLQEQFTEIVFTEIDSNLIDDRFARYLEE